MDFWGIGLSEYLQENPVLDAPSVALTATNRLVQEQAVGIGGTVISLLLC